MLQIGTGGTDGPWLRFRMVWAREHQLLTSDETVRRYVFTAAATHGPAGLGYLRPETGSGAEAEAS
ncbi:hypothetical protein [Streptomyces sp. NPDC047043]|uniref:hypothetical protein n=1 Tax=Streptomyces sp. NPDC047043 TaxID=3154497 RepID=UPI0033DF9646